MGKHSSWGAGGGHYNAEPQKKGYIPVKEMQKENLQHTYLVGTDTAFFFGRIKFDKKKLFFIK